MNVRSTLASMAVFVCSCVSAQTPAPLLVLALRLGEYEQSTATQQTASGYDMVLLVGFSAAPVGATVQVVTPGGRVLDLAQDDDLFLYMASFATRGARDVAFPNGYYTARVTRGGVTSSTAFEVTGAGRVEPVRVTNFDELQAYPSTTPTVRWEPIPGASALDFMELNVYGKDGAELASDSLVATATSGTITTPLPIATEVDGTLNYAKLSFSSANGGATTIGIGDGFLVFFPITCDARPPMIRTAPQSAAVAQGQRLELQVAVEGSGALSYQWYKNGAAITGATTATYTVTSVRAAEAGEYTVHVSNAAGEVVTPNATVVVGPALMTTTYAGRRYVWGAVDGTLTDARFHRPAGLVRDLGGNLYVADSVANTVRKISTTGTVTTLAGQALQSGAADGAAAQSLFASPTGLALDRAGALYVADAKAHTIRRIGTNGVVSTVAGAAWESGSADGTAAAARFNGPSALVFDGGGNLYIADTGNGTIRRLSPEGMVTTVAGLAGQRGATDGTGAAARFRSPCGLALSADDALLVVDSGVAAVRRLTRAGVVSTFAGALEGAVGEADGVGVNARFMLLSAVTVDASGTAYVLDGGNVRRILPDGTVQTLPSFNGDGGGAAGVLTYGYGTGLAVDPVGALFISDMDAGVIGFARLVTASPTPAVMVTTAVQSHAIATGGTFVLSGTTTGPVAYRSWTRNGVAIAGATNTTLVVSGATTADTGNYVLLAGNAAGSSAGAAATISVSPSTAVSRICNLAIRSVAGTGARTLTVGFAVAGDGGSSQPLLLRGVGPALRGYGIANPLPDPVLQLYHNQANIGGNDDWSAALVPIFDSVSAFQLTPGSADAATTVNLAPGVYTAQVTGKGAGGIATAEVYDLAGPAPDGPRLINISARTQVGTGSDILIAGFVITGDVSKTVLMRGVGPTLARYGIPAGEHLGDPKLELYAGSTILASNNDWGGDAQLNDIFNRVGAFGLLDGSAKDAVLLMTLKPGLYSVQVRGVNDATGVALVEVYEVP